NARDLSAYIAAIGDAFINRLIREGVAGLSNVSTPSAPTGGYIPQGLSGSCAGLAGVALSACLDVTESTQNVQTQVDAKACETLEGNKFNECVIGFLTVVMTAPADNSIISGTSTISAAAGYAKGIERVEFYVNNILVATDFTAPYSINIDTESLSDGQYIIIARAFGLDGNSKQSDSITITVDNVVEQDFSGY
ncbi:MAG: Repeat-containing protein, partial [Parcubacteria group bacterium GW2011_GWB1_45_9]